MQGKFDPFKLFSLKMRESLIFSIIVFKKVRKNEF